MIFKTARIRCAYCVTIDIMALVLILLALTDPIYITPAAFAFGFAYAGIGKEFIFQIEHYNFPTKADLAKTKKAYYTVMLVLFAALTTIDITAGVAFLSAFIFMTLLNTKRYKAMEMERFQSAMTYDLYMLLPFIAGVLVLFYA